MNKECKEHEWVSFKGMVIQTMCKKCGAEEPLIDFSIKENLEVINKQEWEDIENEFYKFTNSWTINQSFHEYKKWLKENYTAPEKK